MTHETTLGAAEISAPTSALTDALAKMSGRDLFVLEGAARTLSEISECDFAHYENTACVASVAAPCLVAWLRDALNWETDRRSGRDRDRLKLPIEAISLAEISHGLLLLRTVINLLGRQTGYSELVAFFDVVRQQLADDGAKLIGNPLH